MSHFDSTNASEPVSRRALGETHRDVRAVVLPSFARATSAACRAGNRRGAASGVFACDGPWSQVISGPQPRRWLNICALGDGWWRRLRPGIRSALKRVVVQELAFQKGVAVGLGEFGHVAYLIPTLGDRVYLPVDDLTSLGLVDMTALDASQVRDGEPRAPILSRATCPAQRSRRCSTRMCRSRCSAAKATLGQLNRRT
jgi:hypothetical protein